MAKKKLQMGPVILGSIPRIIAVFDRIASKEEAVCAYADGAKIAEVRFDLIKGPLQDALKFVRTLRQAAPFGILGTLRENKTNANRRLSLFSEIIPQVDAVDIEIDTPIRDEVIARAKGKIIIVSHHDFEKMPDKKSLMQLGQEALKAGAHIVKIAGMTNSAADSARILAFAQSAPYPVIAIAMGDAGKDARIEALKKGSLAAYAFTGNKPVAPGQRSVKEMSEILCRDIPAFGKK